MPTFDKRNANAIISRPDTYGNRLFIMRDPVHKTVIWGWTTGCFVSPYSANLILEENSTQKAIRKHIEQYQNDPDYTEIVTLEDYKNAIKNA